jgi:hypothetical protein
MTPPKSSYLYCRHDARLHVALTKQEQPRTSAAFCTFGHFHQVCAQAAQNSAISQFDFERLDEILDVFKDSIIVMKGRKDIRSKFWDTHRRVAEEREGEFLERHNSDIDITLVFVWFHVARSFSVLTMNNLSVWSVFRGEYVVHRSNGDKSRTRPEQHDQCPLDLTSLYRTGQLFCSLYNASSPSIDLVTVPERCLDPDCCLR